MGYKKVFLDVNVIISFLNDERLDSVVAKKLVGMLIVNGCDIFISEDMLSTIFYIQKDKRKTLEFFKTIQVDWIISPFGKDVIKNAIDISLQKNLDLEDVLQCLCAKESSCDVLITNDHKFYDCGLEICTVDEFLSKK